MSVLETQQLLGLLHKLLLFIFQLFSLNLLLNELLRLLLELIHALLVLVLHLLNFFLQFFQLLQSGLSLKIDFRDLIIELLILTLSLFRPVDAFEFCRDHPLEIGALSAAVASEVAGVPFEAVFLAVELELDELKVLFCDFGF